MRESRSSLYLLPSQPVLGDEAAVARIAETTGVSEYDIRQRCGRNRLSMLMRTDDETALEGLRQRLMGQGHGAAVLSDNEMRRLPYPIAARGASISQSGLSFLDANGRVLETLSNCRDALVIVTNLKRPGRNPVSPIDTRRDPKSPEQFYDDAEKEIAGMLTTYLDGIVIDVIAGGGRRVRLRSRRFNFMTLGDKAGPSVAQNMQTLFAEILRQIERPLVDIGFGGLKSPTVGGMGPQLNDGFPYDRPENDTERELEGYARCLTLLWRKGLFEALLATRPAGTRFHTTSIGTGEGLEETADGAPQFWTPPPGASSGPPAVRSGDLRNIGPLAAVIPTALGLAASGFAMVNGQARTGFSAGMVFAGLLAGVHAFALIARRRRIENVPTSRIRSAAIGMVEVKGKAKAITPLRTPFSSMPCVYYEYGIVANEQADPAADSWLGLWGESRNRERATIQTGHSGHVPFLVEDETGEIEVDPAGAVVEVRSRQSFTKVPFAGGMVPAGTQVVAWEKYIPEGYTVYVLGEMRQLLIDPAVERGHFVERIRELKKDGARMAACDLDGNGVVDAGEWSLAANAITADLRHETLDDTGRTDSIVLARPESGEFFLISERSEKDLARSFALRSRLLFAAGALAVIVGLTLLIQSAR